MIGRVGDGLPAMCLELASLPEHLPGEARLVVGEATDDEDDKALQNFGQTLQNHENSTKFIYFQK